MQVTDAMVAATAESDAAFDGRTWLAMPKSERERYMERSRRSLTAALAEMWQDIETADKPDQKWGQPIIRLWDGKRERHGYWDTNAFAKKPRPYWHYVDSIAVSDDRAKQPTHWAPLLPAPPRGE
jgi:hypothetical protein